MHTHAACMAVVHDPGAFSSETGGDAALRRHDAQRPAGRRADAQHDGRPAPSARPAAREQGPDAADDRAARGRPPRGAPRSSSTTALDAGRVRLRAATSRASCRCRRSASCMGIPEADRHQLFEWIEHSVRLQGRPRGVRDDRRGRARRGRRCSSTAPRSSPRSARIPADDMLSVVCNARLAGEDPPQLTDQELQFFFSSAVGRGRRHHPQRDRGRGRRARPSSPTSWRVLRDDRRADADRRSRRSCAGRIPAAYNRRTATRDRRARRRARSRAGDKVVFWEASANRDERVFADPFRFDLRRDPNPHLGFGHGVHHCLGANLARLEIRVVLDELLRARRHDRAHRPGRVDAQQQAHRHPPPAGAAAYAGLGLRRAASAPGLGGFAAGGRRRRRGVGSSRRERDHAFVDVVDPLAVERARRPRAPEVPPRLHLAAEAER